MKRKINMLLLLFVLFLFSISKVFAKTYKEIQGDQFFENASSIQGAAMNNGTDRAWIRGLQFKHASSNVTANQIKDSDFILPGFKGNNDADGYSTGMYKLEDQETKYKYWSYCLNPSFNGVGTGGIMETDDNFSTQYNENAIKGLEYILINGFYYDKENNKNHLITGLNDRQSYMATNIAVRSWFSLFFIDKAKIRAIDNNDPNKMHNKNDIVWADMYAGASWTSEITNTNVINIVCDMLSSEGKFCGKPYGGITINTLTPQTLGFYVWTGNGALGKMSGSGNVPGYTFTRMIPSGESLTVYNAAGDLFKGALNSLSTGGGNNGNIVNNSSFSVNPKVKITKDNQNQNKFFVDVKFNINGDKNIGGLKIGGAECSNSNIEFSKKANLCINDNCNKEFTFDSLDQYYEVDLNNDISNGNLIKIRYEYVVKDLSVCDNNTEFSINYMVKGNNIESSLVFLEAKGNSLEKQTQIFIDVSNNGNGNNNNNGLNGNDDYIKKSIKRKIKCDGNDPDDDPYTCETSFKTPVCTSTQDNGFIYGPTNIKKCVLGKKDEAGNSYQWKNAIDNNYCKVYCKEDYPKIIMNPIIEDVKCGGTFELRAHITGKKTCYTKGTGNNDEISIDKLKENISNIQTAENVDTLNKVYYLANYFLNNLENGNLKKTYTGMKLDNEGNPIDCYEDDYDFDKDYYFKNNKIYSINLYGSEKINKYDFPTYSWPISAKSHSGIYGDDLSYFCLYDEADDKVTAKDKLNTIINSVKNKLNDINESINNEITSFNSCSGSWINNFKFDIDPKIKWSYTQSIWDNDNNKIKDNKDFYNKLNEKNPDLTYMNKKDKIVNYSISKCTSINDQYECISGKNYISYDEFKNDLNKIPLSYQSINSLTGAMEPIIKEVYDTKYIKVGIEKEWDYFTPSAYYQVYPTGDILVKGGHGFSLSNHQKEYIKEIPNALPVSPIMVGGGKFELIIDRLGEFYDGTNSQGGRIIGSNKSIKHTKGNNFFNENYVCEYHSPCRPDECPDCDYGCIDSSGNNCEFKPDPKCDDCEFKCIDCLFNVDELKLNFKTSSLTNVLGPNRNPGGAGGLAPNRVFGYNWNIVDINPGLMPKLSLIVKKAEKTITMIEKDNEQIYTPEPENNPGGAVPHPTNSKKLSFSVTMTPEVTNFIKEYNKNGEGKNGYGNLSLYCYDYEGKNNKTYENVFCYSTFIDNLINSKEQNVKYGNRPKTGKNHKKEVNINTNSKKDTYQNDFYWNPWNDFEKQNGVIGGPSWY